MGQRPYDAKRTKPKPLGVHNPKIKTKPKNPGSYLFRKAMPAAASVNVTTAATEKNKPGPNPAESRLLDGTEDSMTALTAEIFPGSVDTANLVDAAGPPRSAPNVATNRRRAAASKDPKPVLPDLKRRTPIKPRLMEGAGQAVPSLAPPSATSPLALETAPIGSAKGPRQGGQRPYDAKRTEPKPLGSTTRR